MLHFVTGLSNLIFLSLPQITSTGTCWRRGSILFWKGGDVEGNIWSLTSVVFCDFHKGVLLFFIASFCG